MSATKQEQRAKIFLIKNVSPENYGGSEKYQLLLANQLKKVKFAPIIITNSRQLLSEAKKDGIRTIIPPYNKTQNWSGRRNLLLPLYFLWQKKLYRYYLTLFEKEQPTVINVQSRDDWIAATLAAKKLSIKVLWTDHADFRGWVLQNIDNKFKNIIGKKIIKVAKLADKIILISEYERQYLSSLNATKSLNNIVVIKNGSIDRLKEYSHFRPAKNSFCYVGRIVDYKGIDELIAAFRNVAKQDNTDIKLNLYGDGPDLDKYKNQTVDDSNIVFHGYTNKPLEAIAKNEFFILPSHAEGLSLSLLDAAMMGKTIIATDVGATSEVIENNKTGILVRPKSMKALASAMQAVLEDNKRAKMMANNVRRLYENEYDFDKIFREQMLPLYGKGANE